MWRPASLPNRNIKKLQLVLGSLLIHDVAISLCFTEDCLEMIKFHDLLEQPLFCYWTFWLTTFFLLFLLYSSLPKFPFVLMHANLVVSMLPQEKLVLQALAELTSNQFWRLLPLAQKRREMQWPSSNNTNLSLCCFFFVKMVKKPLFRVLKISFNQWLSITSKWQRKQMTTLLCSSFTQKEMTPPTVCVIL